MPKIADALQNQFDRTWQMLRCSIERLTDEQWRTAPNERMIPARWAFHAIRSVDGYAGESRESFTPVGLEDISWEAASEALPSRQVILEYLEKAAEKMRARISSLSEEELLGPTGFPWTGESILEQMIYTLRHAQYHLGELAAALRYHGADEAEWK